MRLRLALPAGVVVACGALASPAAAGRGGETSGIKVAVSPSVVTTSSTITASFRAPYRLKKGHRWALWLQTNGCDAPDAARGGWKFRRSVAQGKKVTATFTPAAPGVVSMRGTSERMAGSRWCSGWTSVKALDLRSDAHVVGEKRFRIRKSG